MSTIYSTQDEVDAEIAKLKVEVAWLQGELKVERASWRRLTLNNIQPHTSLVIFHTRDGLEVPVLAKSLGVSIQEFKSIIYRPLSVKLVSAVLPGDPPFMLPRDLAREYRYHSMERFEEGEFFSYHWTIFHYHEQP